MKNKFELPIRLNRFKVLFLCIFSLFVYGIFLIFPYIFKYIIDNLDVIVEKNLYLYIFYLVLFFVFSHTLRYLCDYLNQIFCNNEVLKYQKEIAKKISYIDIIDYEKMNKAKILNLINYDISIIYTYINLKVDLVVDSIKILVVAVILLKINFILSIITFILIPFYYLGNYLNKNKVENLARLEMVLSDENMEKAQDVVYKKTSINLFNAWDLFFKKFNDICEKRISVTNKKHKFLILNMEFPKFIESLSPFVILILGASLVYKGLFTLGTLLMFLQYSKMIYTPITSIANLIANANSRLSSFERIREFLNYKNKEENYLKLFKEQEDFLKIKNVSILNEKQEVLFDIDNLNVSKNGLYILKGDNGTGKSTLLNLLSGVYSTEQIKCNGGYFNISKDKLNKIAYLYNPSMLFDASVLENIILSEKKDESKEKLTKKLLKMFKAKNENYIVKTNPSNLSLGEEQKIFLIRTFIKEGDVIFLDEPSSNLDNESKIILKDFLEEEKKKKIIFLIAHDTLYENIADRIYLIEDKKLREI